MEILSAGGETQSPAAGLTVTGTATSLPIASEETQTAGETSTPTATSSSKMEEKETTTQTPVATSSFSFTIPSDLEIGSEPGLSVDISGEKNGRVMVSEGLANDDYVPKFKLIVSLMDKSKQVSDRTINIATRKRYITKVLSFSKLA